MSGYVWDFDQDNPSQDEEISPEVVALLQRLDVPVEILDFDYGEIH
jgi:hypothetical protein